MAKATAGSAKTQADSGRCVLFIGGGVKNGADRLRHAHDVLVAVVRNRCRGSHIKAEAAPPSVGTSSATGPRGKQADVVAKAGFAAVAWVTFFIASLSSALGTAVGAGKRFYGAGFGAIRGPLAGAAFVAPLPAALNAVMDKIVAAAVGTGGELSTGQAFRNLWRRWDKPPMTGGAAVGLRAFFGGASTNRSLAAAGAGRRGRRSESGSAIGRGAAIPAFIPLASFMDSPATEGGTGALRADQFAGAVHRVYLLV